MNGTVIPGTPIAVDIWKTRECSNAKIHFLTHLHGDHVVGLTSSWNKVIYCSEISGKLLIRRHDIKPELIHVLEENESHLLCVDEQHKEYITVTVIDANHCPGAVMFVFEGDFGTILHTGDFRLCKSMIENPKLSQYFGSIDVLYLDNTYCSPSCSFLTRSESLERIVQIIREHMDCDVIIGMRKLGKEELLLKLALELNEWICVPGGTLEIASILDFPNVFRQADDNTGSRVKVVPFSSVSSKQLSIWNETKPTIAILPTALFTGIETSLYELSNLYVIPYSDHSSFSELMKFVSHVRPKRIVPIVGFSAKGPLGNRLDSRANMSCFDHLLDKSSPIQFRKRRKLSGKFLSKNCSVLRTEVQVHFENNTNEQSMNYKASRRRLLPKKRTKGVLFFDDQANVNIQSEDNESIEHISCDSKEMRASKVRSNDKINDTNEISLGDLSPVLPSDIQNKNKLSEFNNSNLNPRVSNPNITSLSNNTSCHTDLFTPKNLSIHLNTSKELLANPDKATDIHVSNVQNKDVLDPTRSALNYEHMHESLTVLHSTSQTNGDTLGPTDISVENKSPIPSTETVASKPKIFKSPDPLNTTSSHSDTRRTVSGTNKTNDDALGPTDNSVEKEPIPFIETVTYKPKNSKPPDYLNVPSSHNDASRTVSETDNSVFTSTEIRPPILSVKKVPKDGQFADRQRFYDHLKSLGYW